jgi:SAM-dependent methyltransferase
MITRQIASFFTYIIGIDPSPSMIDQARASTQALRISYRIGSAEDLDFVEDGTVDMVVASQAAHWFDYNKVWPMLARKLRKGGTVAFLGYKENVIMGHPEATKVLYRYGYDPKAEFMGPHWEQPGRNILRDLYRSIVPPETDFEAIERLEYEPDANGASPIASMGRLMLKTMTLGEMEGYARTFSSHYRWSEAHPGRKSKAKGGGGDIVDEMMEKMLEVEPEWRKQGDSWRDISVGSEWGSVILLARKK